MKLVDIFARKSSVRVCLGGAIGATALAIGVGLVLNRYSTHPLTIFAGRHPGADVVDLAKAIILYDQGTLFVDARTPDAYKDGHIPYAYNLDFHGSDQCYGEFFRRYDRSTPVVAYCGGITGAQNENTCGTSQLLADRLRERGYPNVIVFSEGWAYWEKSGQPVVRGPVAAIVKEIPAVPWVNYVRDLAMLVLGVAAVAFRRHRAAVVLSQLVLGAMFIVSGSMKIFEPDRMAIIIDAYRVMPRAYVPFAALSIPWVEVLGGLCLISCVIPASGALLVAAMNLFFIPALSYRALVVARLFDTSAFSVHFDCGCGLGENFAWVLVLRDIGFLLMAMVALMGLVKWPVRPGPASGGDRGPV